MMLGANLVPDQRSPSQDIVLRRLADLAGLGPDVEHVLCGLEPLPAVKVGGLLASERQAASRPRFIVQGWAARVRWLADGRRQIFGFLLPGDAIGVCLRPSRVASTIVALTTVQSLDASPVQQAVSSDDESWAGLRDAIHLRNSLEEIRLLNQILRLGRQTAYERICHLLLELRERLSAVGIGEDTRFPLPLTQEVLADATGLSVVHVNRILKQLRSERLIDLQAGQVRLLQPEAMETIADYRRPAPAPVSAPASLQ